MAHDRGARGSRPATVGGEGAHAAWPDTTAEARGQRHLEALLRSSERLQGLTDADTLARLAAEQGATLVPDIECAVVVRERAEDDALRVAGASGRIFGALLGSTMPLAGTLSARALAEGVAVETGHADADSPVATRIEGAPQTARLVPLLARTPGGRSVALGVIGYYRAAPGGFIVEERRLLDEYAARVAVALHNARLFAEIDAVRVRAETLAARLAVGVDAAVELGGELEPGRVVRRLIERAVAAVDADRATFAGLDGDALVVEDCYALRGEPILVGTRWIVDDYALLRVAVHERRATQTSWATGGPTAPPTGAEHTLLVPLLAQGRTVATLGASRLQGEPFDEEALAVLQQLGAVAVLALRNARLFEARRDFMNMAAHELRTPLTVLNGYLSMLRDGSCGPPSDAWMRPLEVMAGKVADLSRLVDDLLIGARLERGVTRTAPLAVELGALAAAAAERVRPRAELLGGRVTVHAQPAPVHVVVDVDSIDRILDNLLNNALTYSIDAPVVSISVSAGDGLATVAVEDSGRGVPADLHERIFEQFFRIEDRTAGYPLGTGLGLYISRQLATTQGGRLRIARSAPGEGSVFVLELPERSGG